MIWTTFMIKFFEHDRCEIWSLNTKWKLKILCHLRRLWLITLYIEPRFLNYNWKGYLPPIDKHKRRDSNDLTVGELMIFFWIYHRIILKKKFLDLFWNVKNVILFLLCPQKQKSVDMNNFCTFISFVSSKKIFFHEFKNIYLFTIFKYEVNSP